MAGCIPRELVTAEVDTWTRELEMDNDFKCQLQSDSSVNFVSCELCQCTLEFNCKMLSQMLPLSCA